MRSYGQRCGLARALDVVGDRWTMLIVRELLIRGKCRYTDIQHGLPGIATNVLAERLRDLEKSGVVERIDAAPPIAVPVYRLTERGLALEPALRLLGQWGVPLLATTEKGARILPHWIVLPLRVLLVDNSPASPPAAINVVADDTDLSVEMAAGEVHVSLGTRRIAQATVQGPPDQLLRLFSGQLGLPAARRAGIRWDGDRSLLVRAIRRTPSRAMSEPNAASV
jgi:DNA-binding HxlR family transcriptional regulator